MADATVAPRKIHRFTFSDDIIEPMQYFSRIHKHDTRADFKEAWKTWMTENSALIQGEKDRLTELGFTGDMEDKMYKSVRYYFCKKPAKAPAKETKKRRKYVFMNKDLLSQMDRHIASNLDQDYTFKASFGFEEFIDTNQDMIDDQVQLFLRADLTKDEASQKLKKTYKNRYFLVRKSQVTSEATDETSAVETNE